MDPFTLADLMATSTVHCTHGTITSIDLGGGLTYAPNEFKEQFSYDNLLDAFCLNRSAQAQLLKDLYRKPRAVVWYNYAPCDERPRKRRRVRQKPPTSPPLVSKTVRERVHCESIN